MEHNICEKLIPVLKILYGWDARMSHPVRIGTDPKFPHSYRRAGNQRDDRKETNMHFKNVAYAGGDPI